MLLLTLVAALGKLKLCVGVVPLTLLKKTVSVELPAFAAPAS